MPFEFFDHTGDVGIYLRATSLDALFAAASEALTETLCDRMAVRPLLAETVALSGTELDLLLVDWLSELLYRFDAKGLLVAVAEVTVRERKGGYELAARVRGERLDPAHHTMKVLVKAVTYHALSVRHEAGVWEATVVFDI